MDNFEQYYPFLKLELIALFTYSADVSLENYSIFNLEQNPGAEQNYMGVYAHFHLQIHASYPLFFLQKFIS